MTAPSLDALLPLAHDITAALTSADRSRRLVEVVRRALPCDAVALLQLEGDTLVPAACFGLSEDVYGRRFRRNEHPRLDQLCANDAPTRFPADSPLPDPFDGLVIGGATKLEGHVHSCIGCSLRVEGELVGVLTADALEPGAFDHVDDRFLAHLAALAGAALRTNQLIEALHERAEHLGVVARDLVSDAMQRRGSLLIGTSDLLERLRREINLVARSEFPVLVTGETGVGKELVVRHLHAASTRADQPLVYLNCAALPEAIAESELFGHAKGAFTGAEQARRGKFRTADGGTLFLDEIGELALSLQAKLLRALQQGEIQSVGADEIVHVDVRVIAATNRDIDAEVRAGRFRADLLHRLDVCRLNVPPLRDHAEDVPHLVGHFADANRTRLGIGPVRVSQEAQRALAGGAWPGNVRELENVVARGVLRASARVEPGEPVSVEASDVDLGEPRAAAPAEPPPPLPAGTASLREAVKEYQCRLVREALEQANGNWSAAARALGLDRGNLHHLARRLGLKG